MKQRTEWIFLYKGTLNTYLRVGWIHNKNYGNKLDKVRVQIKSKTTLVDFNSRLDEALALVAGLGKVLAKKTIDDRIGLSDSKSTG